MIIKILLYIILLLQISSIDVLFFKLNLVKKTEGFKTKEYMYTSMRLSNYYYNTIISFSHSKMYSDIYESNFEMTDINITQDDIYPNENALGKIAKGNFTLTNNLNIDLNYMYGDNVGYHTNYLGLSRGVIYDNISIEEEYELDFISQLIRKGVINKYYIYLTPFFNNDGSLYSEPYLEIGRFPPTFDIYQQLYSYTPLNDKYPNKWSVKLSHILFGDISETSIPENNKRNLDADVIFTDSYKETNYIPNKYRGIFNSIFIDQYNCESFSNSYRCPTEMLDKIKLYFVFNGYAHLISNNLIFHIGTDNNYNYSNFDFTENIEYISIDSYVFGNYHKLFDKENNTVRFLYPTDKSYILDVGKITGYENRNGTKKEVPEIEFLRNWEKRLKEEEKSLNMTLKEIEEKKKILDKREGELNNKERNLTNWESDIIQREKDFEQEKIDLQNEIYLCKNELNEEKQKNIILNENIFNLTLTIEMKERSIKDLEKDINNKNKEIDTLNEQVKNQNILNIPTIIVILVFIVLVIIIIILVICLVRKKKLDKKKDEDGLELIKDLN